MDAFITPQNLAIAGLVILLLVALVARYAMKGRRNQEPSNRFGVDHSQDIFEMSQRTRADEQRKERERTAPTLGR